MLLYSGKIIDPANIAVGDVQLIDIAHHLPRINRFGGGTFWPKSVGMHSLDVFDCLMERTPNASLEEQMAALIHDAHEIVFCDLPRPVKHAFQDAKWLEEHKRLCEQFDKVLAIQFGLRWPYPPTVKEADTLAGDREAGLRWGLWHKEPDVHAVTWALFRKLTEIDTARRGLSANIVRPFTK